MRKIVFALFGSGVILLMLHSMNFWPLWNVKIAITDFVTAFVGIIYFALTKKKFKINKKNLSVYFVYMLATGWNTLDSIGMFLWIFHPTFLLLLMLSANEHLKLLRWWTNTYALILFVSLVAWLISWTGKLPEHGLITWGTNLNYTYTNYWFCIRGDFYDIRFNSVFLEPGHTAMIGAFTLALNKFNFKLWSTYVIMFCSLFTLSLAGYVLVFFGILTMKVLYVGDTRKILKRVLFLAPLFVLAYYCGLTYNKGDNYINDMIFYRLEYDEEKGFSGNNRTYEQTDAYFKRFIQTENLITGLNRDEFLRKLRGETIKGAGYKMYLLQFGIIGTFFMFLSYWLISRRALDKRFILLLSIIYILAFWQRAYSWWESWLFLFLFATSVKPQEVISKGKKLSLKLNSIHLNKS